MDNNANCRLYCNKTKPGFSTKLIEFESYNINLPIY